MRRQSPLIAKNFRKTFVSVEKDYETILKKLFVESKPYSDFLKKLLVVNTPDCLDVSQMQFQMAVEEYDVARLKKEGYIRTVPRLELDEHSQVKSYIFLDFSNFRPAGNQKFRDCDVNFTIVCNTSQWELDDYKLRPYQIAGYIDGILDGAKMSGIGILNFQYCTDFAFNEELCGLELSYTATHMMDSDDTTRIAPEWEGPQINQQLNDR